MGRRPIVAVISVCVHALVLVALMTADWWRPISEWPTPREAMAFAGEISPPIKVTGPEIRPAARRAAGETTTPASSPQPEAAPSAPPEMIGKEVIVSGFSGPDESNPIGGPPSGPIAVAPPAQPVTPPAPPPQAPVRLHSGIQAPQRVVYVTPFYPVIAKSAHVQGVVIIEATLDERGNVVRTQVLRSIPLLDAAAIDAVRQWKFTPTLLNGIAVPIVMTVTVNFTLQ